MSDRRTFHSRGQELLEFALILPIFLLLAFGILDLGLATYSYSSLQSAAREGARYAIVNACNDAGTIAYVQGRALGLDPTDVTVQAPVWTEDTVEVTVLYDYQLLTPFVGAFIPGGSVTMRSSSTMLRETWLQPDCG